MSSSCRKRAPVSALTWASGQSNSPSSTSSGQLWFGLPHLGHHDGARARMVQMRDLNLLAQTRIQPQNALDAGAGRAIPGPALIVEPVGVQQIQPVRHYRRRITVSTIGRRSQICWLAFFSARRHGLFDHRSSSRRARPSASSTRLSARSARSSSTSLQRIVVVARQADARAPRSPSDLAAPVQDHGDDQHAVVGGVAALAQGLAVLRRQHAAVDDRAGRRAPRR